MSQNRSNRYAKKQKEPKKVGALGLVLAGFVLIFMAALALFSPISASLNEAFASGSPDLKVDREKVDLGDVKLGESVSVSFKVTNAGNKTLRFNQDPYVEVIKGC